MKAIHKVIGIVIICLGSIFLNITVDNEDSLNVFLKIAGVTFIGCGILYLKKVA